MGSRRIPAAVTLRRHLLGLGVLVLGFVAAAGVRVQVALDDPNFDAHEPLGMLKSDPALLTYFTERILEADGGVPADFGADPRVQHPGLTDVPAEFTVGQEFLVAWAHLFLGRRLGLPLHVTATVLMALTASLAGLAVYGLVLVRTGRRAWALAAAGLFWLLPANYRSIGFVLVREDLSFPLFALHLAVLGWAIARGGALRFLAAGALLAAALATWHAMGFFVLLELGCLFGWAALRPSGRAPRGVHAAWLAPLAAGLGVPALATTGMLVGPTAFLGAGLAVVLALASRPRGVRIAAGLATVLLLLIAARVLLPGPSAYAHVHDVLAAKLLHLGRRPADPLAMSFDARLLWQGPFETLSPAALPGLLGVALLALPLALVLLGARGVRAPERALAAFFALSLVVAWLIGRTVVLAGLLAPTLLGIAGAAWAERATRRSFAVGLAALGLLLQAAVFARFVARHEIYWYAPAARGQEIAALVRWVDEHVPDEEAVASDFVNSTAILLHARNPILLHPKYETDASRRRAEVFLNTLFHAPPEDLERLLLERFRTRWLVVDRHVLLADSGYLAGLREGEQPEPWTGVARLASSDAEVLAGVPGFELLYRSPPGIRWPDGRPSDRFRVFRLTGASTTR